MPCKQFHLGNYGKKKVSIYVHCRCSIFTQMFLTQILAGFTNTEPCILRASWAQPHLQTVFLLRGWRSHNLFPQAISLCEGQACSLPLQCPVRASSNVACWHSLRSPLTVLVHTYIWEVCAKLSRSPHTKNKTYLAPKMSFLARSIPETTFTLRIRDSPCWKKKTIKLETDLQRTALLYPTLKSMISTQSCLVI